MDLQTPGYGNGRAPTKEARYGGYVEREGQGRRIKAPHSRYGDEGGRGGKGRMKMVRHGIFSPSAVVPREGFL